jgi:hypothetical protein
LTNFCTSSPTPNKVREQENRVVLAAFLPIEAADDWALLAPACIELTLVGLGIGVAGPIL